MATQILLTPLMEKAIESYRTGSNLRESAKIAHIRKPTLKHYLMQRGVFRVRQYKYHCLGCEKPLPTRRGCKASKRCPSCAIVHARSMRKVKVV